MGYSLKPIVDNSSPVYLSHVLLKKRLRELEGIAEEKYQLEDVYAEQQDKMAECTRR